MNLAKAAISFFLLLTYSIGYAHYLIPHNQSHESNVHTDLNKGHHNHHLHTSEESLSSEHKHISHDNHFDEDLFDLIVCVFNESEHPTNGCSIQHYLPTEFSDISTKDNAKVKYTILLLAVFAKGEQCQQTFRYDTDLDVAYLLPSLEDSPYRGPPSISFPSAGA